MSVQRTNFVGDSKNKVKAASNRFGKFAIEVEIHPSYIDRDISKNPDGTDKPGMDVPLVPLSDKDKSRTVIDRKKQRPDIYGPREQPELQVPLYHEDQLPDGRDVPTPTPHEQPPRGVTYLD